MSGKTFKSIYYHIIFKTKDQYPYLNENIKEQVYHYIWNKSKKLGFYLHRIGGTKNHVHLLIYIPPKISVSQAVGLLKGSSSYSINQELVGDDILYWQQGFGVLTFSKSDFKWVYDYVKNQVEHHKSGDIVEEYERINFDGK